MARPRDLVKIGYLRGQIGRQEDLKKPLLAGNGYTGRFLEAARLLKAKVASGVLGSSFADNPTKMAKVTAIAGKFLGGEIFGPKWVQKDPFWTEIGLYEADLRTLRARKVPETLKARQAPLAWQIKGFQLTSRRVLGLTPQN